MIAAGELADAASVAAWHLRQPAMTPCPTTTSPRIRQATWPGAGPSAGSASATVSARPRAR